ncbi:hypothetical protein Dsin_015179 [Dipteronia sinensis]|uniref:CRM domain-containing protein n=1 Tax=Dipteronia sinensis TaxID=43782 RepID=A0AAE0E5Q4_9ROSI|nr:hypothetical protein Dsin_015179 [Dipteronia sinensis]
MALLAKYSSFGNHCSTSLYPLLVHHQTHSPNTTESIRIGTRCAHHQIKAQLETPRTKKKLKPSFFEQIRHKWSFKTISPRDTFPWQQQEEPLEQEEEKPQLSSGVTLSETKMDVESPPVSEPVSSALQNRFGSAPWIHGNNSRETQLNSHPKISQFSIREEENVKLVKDKLDNDVDCDNKFKASLVKIDANPVEISRDKETAIVGGLNSVGSVKKSLVKANGVTSGAIGLPWKRNVNLTGEGDRRVVRSNTELAERMIPEHELQRLRNVSLRMLERIKVGNAGITQALVDSIHEKWKLDEVVKLKFEESHSLNMRRTHEILEHRTGGLIIWRSGSSVVLFRGMTYKLPCVQSFTKQNQMQHLKGVKFDVTRNVEEGNSVRIMKPFDPDSTKPLRNLSEEELIDLNELNFLLDELGPRFVDWTGCEPLPVDADLLPPVVPDYKPPFRLLPYGVRHSLRDKEMTTLRRLARNMPPHFALGRNRELQGLAKAMAKLWENSALAKIAIKRGVLNTRNERMAEELKRLTGGTLLSRNKDFIVFYRGNDFLPPVVTEALKERVKLADLRQNEEEQARQVSSSLMESKAKVSGVPLVAGTLAETMAATSRWGKKPGNEDLEEMMRDSALGKHASLVKHLEKKLVIAKRRLRRAEIALAKLQKNLDPAELPSDLETITNEERFLFRRIGLSMKPYLLLGRRGVYGGTVENMHLHWKFRELVKIIVKGKTPGQVKQIAISLEAESGGILVSLDKTTKGYAIIVYRGKNYLRPLKMRPDNLLTRRQALAQSIELQRREALKHHVMDLEDRIDLVKSEMEEMKTAKMIVLDKSLYSKPDDVCFSDDETEEDEADEAYPEPYASKNDGEYSQNEFMQQRRPF